MGIRWLLLAPLAGGLLLAACGDPAAVDQATTTRTPLAAASVVVTQTGDTDVVIPPGGVSFGLDAARLLVAHVRLHSNAPAPRTVVVRASLYDATGRIIGDAGGAAIEVPPGSDTTVELSGPTPSGTISAVTLEVHTVPARTPAPSAGP